MTRGVLVLCAMFFALSHPVEAQEPKKIPRIGLLMSASTAESAAFIEAFRQGLRELGYVEGKNIVLEIRGGQADPGRLSKLAAELVKLKPDVIVAGATFAVHALKNRAGTIPIVMRYGGDPVRSGLITSFARPGGNMTGLASINRGLIGKRFEVLTEVVPRAKHVAVLSAQSNPDRFIRTNDYKSIESASKTLDVTLHVLSAPDSDAIAKALLALKTEGISAVMVVPSPLFVQHRERIIDHAANIRLPTIYPQSLFVESGGLISYGADFSDEYRRLATYVDKILKGTKPADIPVEQPTKFELVINLRTAKQIGLTVPPNVLARADKVIR